MSYAKVAELQARGAVHFHAVVRLDDRTGDYQPPRIDVTSGRLADAVRKAATHVRVTVDAGSEAVVLRFGEQLDIQTIQPTAKPGFRPDGQLTQGTVAAYISKYGTKAAEDFGLGGKPLDPASARTLNLSDHVVRIIDTCHQLAAATPELAGLRRWTHMLGYRGHFSTRSRRYSVTLGSIQRERATYCRQRDHTNQPARDAGQPEPDDDGAELVIHEWEFAGIGWATSGDAAMAAASAAWAREQRELSRDT